MKIFLAPFVYLVGMFVVYLFAPSARRADIQAAMRLSAPFYMICDIVIVMFTIPAQLLWRHPGLNYLAWTVCLVLLIVSVVKALKATPPEDPVEKGPL